MGIIDAGGIIEKGVPTELLAKRGSRTLEELFLHLTGRQLRDT